MKEKIVPLTLLFSIVFNLIACVQSEMSWTNKENSPQPLRQVVGLPNIAVGNLNPAARSPGLEVLCISFYDVPGGYCHYFAPGAPYSVLPRSKNLTRSGGE